MTERNANYGSCRFTMSDKTFTSFDEYIRQGEPEKKQRAENWSIAIGLQAVDGLK